MSFSEQGVKRVCNLRAGLGGIRSVRQGKAREHRVLGPWTNGFLSLVLGLQRTKPWLSQSLSVGLSQTCELLSWSFGVPARVMLMFQALERQYGMQDTAPARWPGSSIPLPVATLQARSATQENEALGGCG